MESRQLEDAREVLNDALKGLEKTYGKTSVELVPAIRFLASTNAKLGKTRQQEKLYERALQLVEKDIGKASAQYADLSYEAGNSLILYSGNKKAVQAGFEMLQGALDTYATLFNSSDPMSVHTALALGEIFLRTEQLGAAEHFFIRALKDLNEGDFALVDDQIRAHSGLVSSYVLDGRPDMASESCDAVRFWTYSPLPNAQDISRVAPVYPWNLMMMGAEGHVDFSFTVNENGHIRSPEIVAVDGHKDFVPAAIRALCAFKYEPRLENGKFVSVEDVKTRISFKFDVQ